MCRHILNAQVSVRAPCCKLWFDCPECHAERWGEDHELMPTMDMVMLCKKCKRAFRKEVSEFEEADEYCPHCDNHYIIEAKTQQTEGRMVVTVQQERGHEHKMMKDDREKDRGQTLDRSSAWQQTDGMQPDFTDEELDELY